MNAIEMNDLTKYYGKTRGIENLSLRVPKGDFFGFIGPNGAGKSTLMKLLMRLYDPSEGRILVNGIDIREYQVKAYRNLFATAFQNGKFLRTPWRRMC